MVRPLIRRTRTPIKTRDQTAPSGQRQNTPHVAAERVAGLLFGDGRKCKTGPSARIRKNHTELPSGLLDTIVDTVEIGEVA